MQWVWNPIPFVSANYQIIASFYIFVYHCIKSQVIDILYIHIILNTFHQLAIHTMQYYILCKSSIPIFSSSTNFQIYWQIDSYCTCRTLLHVLADKMNTIQSIFLLHLHIIQSIFLIQQLLSAFVYLQWREAHKFVLQKETWTFWYNYIQNFQHQRYPFERNPLVSLYYSYRVPSLVPPNTTTCTLSV